MTKRLLLPLALLLAVPAPARAERFPAVSKGPVILGVGQTEAWIAWYTAHHQGRARLPNACSSGEANGTLPTLTLKQAGAEPRTFEDATCSRFHKVHLTDLKPGTAYSFALDKPLPGGATAEGGFTTAPAASAASLRFVVYGDTRDEPVGRPSTRPQHEAVVKAIVERETGAAFLLNTGDLALNLPAVSGEDRGYAAFFEVERPLLARWPLAMAFGNHESLDTEYYDNLMSAQVLSGAPHPRYYSFDWGPAHVAVLDAYEGRADPLKAGQRQGLITDAQASWLDADLAAARARGLKLFVLSHQGAYSHGTPGQAHGGLKDVQTKVVPLLVKYGALALFAGHDHYYQRGREGCLGYLVVGGGGAPMYEPDAKAPGVLLTRKIPSYLAVTVTEAGAQGEARDVKGEVFDRFDFEPAACPATDGGIGADAAIKSAAPAMVHEEGSE